LITETLRLKILTFSRFDFRLSS